MVAGFPTPGGGPGSVTAFDLKVGRKFTYKGRKKSFLVAAEVAPNGAFRGRNFSSQIARGTPYEERVKVRRYLESVY